MQLFLIRGFRLGVILATIASTFAVGQATVSAGNSPITVDVSAPASAAIGDELTYTIVVTNTGGAKLTEVALTDVVNGLSGVDQDNRLALTSDVGTCGQDGNTVYCDAGTLQGFQSWTVTIRGVVNGSTGTTLNNTASATGTKSATTYTASDTTTTQITGSGGGSDAPDLISTIKAPSTTPPSHDTVYTVTVNNLGSVKASDIALTVSLDPDLDYLTYTATNLFVCSPGTDPDTGDPLLTCTGGAVNAGASATVQVGVVAPSFDTEVTVTAAVDPYDTILETNELNNASQATTQVGSVPPAETLAIEKTDHADPLAPGETLTYTIVLENTSASRADYVEVVDGTQGLEAASVEVGWAYSGNVQNNPVPLDCVVAAPKVTCTTTRFQPGQVATITISGTVIARAGTSIINTATVNGNIKNTGVTNTASTITTVKPAIDLSVTQHRELPHPPEPVRAADRFDLLITVGNSGLYDAENVLVRQPLPAGPDSTTPRDDVYFDGFSASAAGTTCTVGVDNVLRCNIPVVAGESNSSPGGTTETIRLRLIAPHRIGQLSSTVTVDPANAIAEHDETNNTYTTVIDVLTGIDLTVSKTGTPDPVARNGTLTYTLTIENLGTQDTTGVVVRDVLPTGTVFRSASDVPSSTAPDPAVRHNFTCSATGNVVECVGGRLEGTYAGSLTELVDVATIEIDVFAPDEPGRYHNEVRVDPYGAIPEKNETNNLFLLDTEVINVSDPDPQKHGQYKELFIDDIVEVTSDPAKPFATSGVLNYDLTVGNYGTAPAGAPDNVVVRITLPAGSIFRDAYDLGVIGDDSFVCAHKGGSIVDCWGGTVESLGTRGIRIETFAPPSPVTARLQAMIDPDNTIGESDETNNANAETTTIAAGEITEVQGTYIDLKPSIVGPDEIGTSSTLDYAIRITNPGSADAFDVRFEAVLPEGSIYRTADDADPATVAAAFTCQHANQVVTCAGGRVNNGGGARTVNLRLFAPEQPSSSSADMARLQVSVDPDNAIPEGHEGNNAAEHLTKVTVDGPGGYIDLSIAKTAQVEPENATDSGAVKIGAPFSYHVDVWNDGTDDAFNVVVRDPLPSDVTFVAAYAQDIASNFTCQHSSGVVTCSGGYVKGGGSPTTNTRRIVIEVRAPMQHDRNLINQAFVDPDDAKPEQSEVNNAAQHSITVKSPFDLLPEMDTGGATTAGQEGDWVFRVKNDGSDTALNALVVADFSPGTILLNVRPNQPGWSCQVYENPVNQVRCVGDVPPPGGTDPSFTVRYYRTSDESEVHSTVIADPDNTIVESKEENNRVSQTG